MARDRKPLGQILKEMGVVTEADIQEAIACQKESGGSLGDAFLQLKKINREELTIALATQSGMDFVDIEDFDITPDLIEKIPASMAEIYNVFPLQFHPAKKLLKIAVSDPEKIHMLDELRFLLPGVQLRPVIAGEEQIAQFVAKHYAQVEEDFTGTLQALEGFDGTEGYGADGKLDLSSVEDQINAAPIVALVNQILHKGIQAKAADIHFEPFEHDFKVRMRIDGVLYELTAPPKRLAPVIISRVKILSKLDIAETRMPQDGRIELTISGRPIDLRVSTLPTMFGESCVMRILDRDNVDLNLENVGLRRKELELFRKLISKPNGIILVTGPTGSGKTTTLYSALAELNDISSKIITTEDPVEYNLDGIVQVAVNDEIGLTYAACLRSILRQDPDIILVGEIRDRDTAVIAIEASLTGHLVLSTLHTNDAPSSITRMIDLGIEPFLIAATLEAIIAQRLVRRICLECKQEFLPSREQILELGLKPDQVQSRKFAHGAGCAACNGTGYKGRMAIYEIMVISDKLKAAVLESASTEELRTIARGEGMRTLRQGGILGVLDGITTIEEVSRETQMGG